MLGKKIYSLLAAAIVVAMCSVAANATTMYCVCPGATSAPYYYDFGTEVATQMTSCEIDGLEGLPCYSATMSSSTTGFILITTNPSSDWNGTRASYGGTSDIYASNLTDINGDFYLFWAYESSIAYNLTSTTSGTASGLAFMSDGNGWGSSGSSLNSTSYSYVYSADVTLSSSIAKLLVCSHDNDYGNKVGTSSTVYVDTQYALSSSNTNDVTANIASGSYTVYYLSDNVTEGGYLYITAASESSSGGDSDDDDDTDDDGDETDTSSSYDVRLTGGGNSWANTSSNCCFTDSGDGQTFTYSFTEGAPYTWSGQEFKIVDYTSGVDDNTAAWYSLSNTTVVLGTESSIYQSNNNSYMPTLTSGTSYTITVTFLNSDYPGSQHNEIHILIEASSSSSDDSDDDDDSTSGTTSDYYTIYIHDKGTSGYYLYAWGTDSESALVYYLADGTYSTNNNWPGFDFSGLPTTIVEDVEYYYLQISSSLTNIGALITDSSKNKYTSDISVTGDVYILIDGSTVSLAQPSASSLQSSSGSATDVSSYGYFYITGDWNELNGKWLPNPYGLFSTNTDEDTKDTYSLVATIYNFSGKFKVLGTESSSKQYHVESGCAWLTSTSGVLALNNRYVLADNNTNSLISNNMLIADETTSYSKLIFYFNPSDGAFMITEDTLTDDEESAYEYKYYLATSFNDYYNGRTTESSDSDEDGEESTTSINTVAIKVYLGDNSSSFLGSQESAYIYSWYYTEAGVKVEELGAWPGTALDVSDGYATLMLERKASANFIINNGLSGGASGENQTHDIVLGNYSGNVTITIGSQETTYFTSDSGTAYYYSHTVSTTPSSEISFYMVPDEASVPYIYVWDTSTSSDVSSAWPGTQFSEIVEVSGHYLYKLTYSSVSNPLGAVINDGTDTDDYKYDKTVDITSILADVYLDWLNDENENQDDGIGYYWNDTYNTVALISVDQSTDDESLSKYTLDDSTPYLFKMVAISDLMDSEQEAATYTDAGGNEQKYDVQSEAWYTVIYDITGSDEAEIANTSATDLDNTESYTVDVIDGSIYTFDESTDFYVIASNAHGDLVKYSTGGSVGYSQYLTYSTGNGNTTLTTPSTMYEKDSNGGSKYSYAFFVVETQNVSSTTSAAARSNVKTAKATTDGSYAVVGGGSTLNVMVYLATEEGVETGINKVDSEGNVIVAERYFRLDGIEVAEPSTDNRQIYVILRTYDDGSVKAFKEVR